VYRRRGKPARAGGPEGAQRWSAGGPDRWSVGAPGGSSARGREQPCSSAPAVLSAAWVGPASSAGEGHPLRVVCVHPF
jgi:hypothetical protein